MGNAGPAVSQAIHAEVIFLLTARDPAKPWRYPQVPLDILRVQAGISVGRMCIIVHTRVTCAWTFLSMMAWMAWRIVVQASLAVDELVVEATVLFDILFAGMVELMERIRDRLPLHVLS